MAHQIYKQPFSEWIADRVQDCSNAMKRGEDPSVIFTCSAPAGSITFELRIMECPGFKREEIKIPAAD